MQAKSVLDVSIYFLGKLGQMSAMKLQKLCYYAQAWSLVWDDEPLFNEPIQAWANGPVCPALYVLHRGMFRVDRSTFEKRGSSDGLTEAQRETLDEVIRYYGEKSPFWLSELTHAEDPWKDARSDLGPGERGTSEITHASMAEYYGSLVLAEEE